MIVAQGSTKTLATFHYPDSAAIQYLGRHQSIAETLVISFTVVVLNILGDDLAQVPFAERDHLAQTLLPDFAAHGDALLGVLVDQVQFACPNPRPRT
jgi:hypothetical protein